MIAVANEQKKRIHPHKFTMWIAIGSIVMMFAGLTSAYIIKRNQANWLSFELPIAFWYSTAAIVISSITIWLAERYFKDREMVKYRQLLIATLVFGVVFIILQVIGFSQMWNRGLTLTKNVSISFLYPIIGLHALHVMGGVIALAVMFFRGFNKSKRNYSSIPVEIVSTYWHFVDFLWIYLLIFLVLIR
ncbi:MAG: heme-copper oxidase subunit III [Chitinophagaceae bacterium]